MTKLRILVPHDGSAFCRQIYPYLLKFFPPEQAELVLLRVGERPVAGTITQTPRPVSLDVTVTAYASSQEATLALHPIYASQEWESSESLLRSTLVGDVHQLKEAGYTVTVEVRLGECADEIVRYALHDSVDAIAMATHFRTGLQKMLHGSIAQALSAHSGIPLFTVHPTDA